MLTHLDTNSNQKAEDVMENKIDETLADIRQRYIDNNWDYEIFESFENLLELLREVVIDADRMSGH